MSGGLPSGVNAPGATDFGRSPGHAFSDRLADCGATPAFPASTGSARAAGDASRCASLDAAPVPQSSWLRHSL